VLYPSIVLQQSQGNIQRRPAVYMKIKHAKLRHRAIHVPMTKATDVLYRKMVAYNTEATAILEYLTEVMRQTNPNSVEMVRLYNLMIKKDETVIDCAHKLAPYQTPKLESVEVKSRIEHKFVIKAPNHMSSVEDWAKKTGADNMDITEHTNKEVKFKEVKPSLQDFDQEEPPKRLN
jgi:hypothetical protein